MTRVFVQGRITAPTRAQVLRRLARRWRWDKLWRLAWVYGDWWEWLIELEPNGFRREG